MSCLIALIVMLALPGLSCSSPSSNSTPSSVISPITVPATSASSPLAPSPSSARNVSLPGTNNTNSSCFVLLRDWPTRTCELHVDDCRNLSVEQADDCTLCERGYGAYATMLECLNPFPQPSTPAPNPSPSPSLPSPSAVHNSPPSLSSPIHSPLQSPSHGPSPSPVHSSPSPLPSPPKLLTSPLKSPTTSPSPSSTPKPSPASSPKPSPASSPKPSPASSPKPSPASSPKPSPASSPKPSPTSSPSPSYSPMHSPLIPSPKSSTSPGASPSHSPVHTSPPSINAQPSPSSTSPSLVTGPTCWVLIRDFPTRSCQFHTDNCLNLSVSQIDDCTLCSRGYGAYATQQECELQAPSSGTVNIPGTNVYATTCWVLIRDFPTRSCQYHTDNCLNLSISQIDDCTLCSRGYGAYPTQPECELPPAQSGPYGGATQSASAVDPATFPSPALPNPSGCGSSTLAWLAGRQGDPSSSCPHWQPGVQRWENPQTWGSQGVPQQWTAVTLPANTKVMITQCSFPAGAGTFSSITIPPSSQLIFDDATVLLTVGTIWVQGMLRAGSALCRIQSPITITFASQLMAGTDMSNMGIQVQSSGQLDLHGVLFQPTWTRLAATTLPGQNWASLLQPVNWQPGQLVAIMTSIFRDEYHNQNEVLTISSVSSDGKTLVFTSNLQLPHYSGSEYQTEIALLSRSIVLQSSADVEQTWSGANVKIQGQGRLEGVLAYRMGHYNTLGVYPFHWHMLGTVANKTSYVNDCAVFRSFYRCYVVHGTSYLTLLNNVGFHAMGSCFYLEDGVEEYNWFQNNLAAFIHVIGDPSGGITQTGTTSVQSANLAQPADAAAAGFYISNANNAFVNNAASGGWTGYSFPVLDAPIGDYAWMTNFVPSQRPLWQFTGNTAHSSGYFYIMAGGIYVGGKVWLDSSNTLNYNSGRWSRDTRDLQGNPATQVFKNNKVWLAQWGISHWGSRVTVDQWENHDCTRGANIFGDAQLSNAVINANSSNVWSQFPLSIWDLDPISGFRWYDTEVRTILANITFMNFVYQPDLPATLRQSIWSSMSQSDEYKPGYISASTGIGYQNVDFRAFLRNVPVSTGSSRFFNWVDWDGSASLRGKPTIMGSYPSWWQLDSSCQLEPSSGSWMCDWLPWRTVARLDVHIGGYTSQAATGFALPPTPGNYAGYVAQFGYRGSSNRSMIITRNDGFTGVTGTGGWYMHLSQGVTPFLKVWVTQVPPGTSLIFATRYPPGTTFSIARNFVYYPGYYAQLTQASSLYAVLTGSGELYYFDGKHLFIKIVDPGDGTIPAALTVGNVKVWGDRYFTMSYDISATNLNCPTASSGGSFCPMQDAWDDIPDFLPSFNPWVQPYCWDISNAPQYSCAQQAGWGKCNADFMFSGLDVISQTLGSFCAKTCGRCQGSQPVCIDITPPASGNRTCAIRRTAGECYNSFLSSNGFCGYTCGFCRGNGQPPCIEKQVGDGYTCAQRQGWSQCNLDWMVSNHFCDVTCGRCNPGCQDKVPTDGVSCSQRAVWGNCNDAWIVDAGYCAATCGRC